MILPAFQTPLVRILEVSAVGNIAEKERFEPSFAPHSITYDGAYGVFFATSVDDKRTVWEIDPDGGRAKKLFTLDPKVFGGVEISNMHYASNTGTIFFVCTPCRTIFEVVLPDPHPSPHCLVPSPRKKHPKPQSNPSLPFPFLLVGS